MKAIPATTREQIRQDYESGMTYAELVEKYHVSKGSLSNIINNPDPPASQPKRQDFIATMPPRQSSQGFILPSSHAPESGHHWPYPTIDITPGRSKPRRQPPQLERDERGRFLPRGSESPEQPNSTALVRSEPERAIAVRKPFNPHDATPIFLALWDLLKWIGRKLFGESKPAQANNQRLLTSGNHQAANQSPYFAPPYQTGILAQPDYGMDTINGLNGMETINGLSSSMNYGLTAQEIYGNNLSPYESAYYVCQHCGQFHFNGNNCPWNSYQQ